ncbi:MAG: hypothetical protein AAFP97_11955 [Pseudomonadota bacterium]
MPQLDLVVTRPPDRLILHPELDLFTSPYEGIETLGRHYAFLSGDLIGLEWRTQDGKAINQNDLYDRSLYMPASYYPEDHLFDDVKRTQAQPMKIATLYKPKGQPPSQNDQINEWIVSIQKAIWRTQVRRSKRRK